MCVCVSPSPRRLSGAGTYALGRPRSGGAPAACPGVGWGRAACHSRRLWGGGGGRPGRASRSAGLRGAPRGSAAAAAASRGRPCPPSAAPSRGSLPRPGVCGERWSGNGGLQPPPRPPPVLPSVRTGGEKSLFQRRASFIARPLHFSPACQAPLRSNIHHESR